MSTARINVVIPGLLPNEAEKFSVDLLRAMKTSAERWLRECTVAIAGTSLTPEGDIQYAVDIGASDDQSAALSAMIASH